MPSTWSKRHYIAIATRLQLVAQEFYDKGMYAELEGVHTAIHGIAGLFASDNPFFCKETFVKASSEAENWRNQI